MNDEEEKDLMVKVENLDVISEREDEELMEEDIDEEEFVKKNKRNKKRVIRKSTANIKSNEFN